MRIARILDSLDGSIAALRNRALLLIGVAGALGRSDLAAIRVESLTWHAKGVAIDLPQAIDDGAKRRTVEIPFAAGDQPCAVKALKDWLTIAKLEKGKVFRSFSASGLIRKGINPNSIGGLVQEMVRKAQISSPRSYGGHSLRIGNLIPSSSRDGGSFAKQENGANTVTRKRTRVDQLDRQAAERSLGL